MKTIILTVLIFVLNSLLLSQENIIIIIRDVDCSGFQKVKLYLSVLDRNGIPILDVDSTNTSIVENINYKIKNHTIENLYKSKEGIAICILIDASGSMEGPPLENVIAGLERIINDFREQDKMAIGYFNDDFYKLVDFTTDKEVLINNLNNIDVEEKNTELFYSVLQSIEWLKSIKQPKRKVLIVFSDGKDEGQIDTIQYSIDKCVEEVSGSEISVFTIGSTSQDTHYLNNLKRIAEASEGASENYYRVFQPNELRQIIPKVYNKIKFEYILTYYSCESSDTNILVTIELNYKNTKYTFETTYKSPPEIYSYSPYCKPWWLWYVIIGGSSLILLLIFIIIFKQRTFKKKEKQLKEEFQIRLEEYKKLINKGDRSINTLNAKKDLIAIIEKLNLKFPYVKVVSEANEEDKEKQEFIFAMEFKIGRKDDNDLIIKDGYVGHNHAKINAKDDSYYIEDLNSKNGTYLNNYKLSLNERFSLRSGDIIKIGYTEIEFIEPE